MIKSKIFESEETLNEFVNSNEIKFHCKIISIETLKTEYRSDLPLLNGEVFSFEKDVIKLWYENF